MKRTQREANRATFRPQKSAKSMLLMSVLVPIIVLIAIAMSRPTVGFADDPIGFADDPMDAPLLDPAPYKIYLPAVGGRAPRMRLLADCVDGDSDGYVVCGGCTPASGQQCGECDDGDPGIYPGAAELCDGVDNDCDGAIDNGFVVGREGPASTGYDCADYLDNDGDGLVDDADPECQAAYCFHDFPLGCSPTITGTSCCLTRSFRECNVDGSGTFCPVPASGINVPTLEIPYTLTCHDGEDNDCDLLIDGDDPDCPHMAEQCNSLDDDYDGDIDEGFILIDDTGAMRSLWDPCTMGLGICARNGTVICDGDGLSAVCTATPGKAKTEAFGAGNSCSDGLDNDCDGLADGDDPDCAPVASPEICDGVDNDLDGDIDEGFDVGAPCSAGKGVCQNSGVKICKADGSGTMCNAFPLPGSVEGPSGPTCSDGLDNDCDGLVDTADPSCNAAAAGLWVNCALPYTLGQPGGDCNGKHSVQYQVLSADPLNTQVQAEFLGLSPEGVVLDILPGIQVGEEAHLASRLDPIDFKMASKTNSQGTRHEVFAPVPMLHVTARSGDAEAQAYCSNIPYLDVTHPSGAVVSVSSGDVTEVTAGLPLVDPETLVVWVDGVDILTPLGIDPATDFPGGPYSGTVMVEGEAVEVIDLWVDVGNGIDDPSSNMLTMILKNLGGGGHIIYVDGEPQPMRDPLTEECHIDDVADAGTVAAFMVEIASPADQSVIYPVPSGGVPVTGTVWHGREIAGLKLNGMPVDVSGQAFTPGDGVTSADEYVLSFDEPLAETDLAQAIAGTAPLGTVQRGSNEVVADASDDLGNRAFDTAIFAVGNVLAPEQAASIAGMVESDLNAAQEAAYESLLAPGGLLEVTDTELDNAFVAGLEESAIDAVFERLCPDAVDEFKSRMDANIRGRNLGTVTVDPDCSCKVTANLVIESITFGDDYACDATFGDGEIDVTFELPDVTVVIVANNRCKVKGLFGECLAETVLDVEATTIVNDPVFSFTITEEGIENNEPPDEDSKSFVIGSLRYPGSNGESLENNSEVWKNNSDINCWGAAVCSFFEGVAGFLIEVFTLGFVDAEDVFDFVSIEFELADFEDLAGASEPDPVGIGEMQIDEQEVEEFGRAAFAPTLEDVEITPDGMTASFSAIFETQVADPGVEDNPGAALSPAPPPGLPQGSSAQNAFIVLADDTINQLFASLAESGGLQTSCQNTGKEVGDLLPPDCETLSGETVTATAAIQGICHGVRDDDCEALSGSTVILEATEQGACHGVKGDNCNTIPVGGLVAAITERFVCNNTPDLNLTATDPLLFCSQQSIPPQLLVNDDLGTGPVETSLLLNDLSVSMVVDRSDPGLEGELAGTPDCFAGDASTLADCNLFAACLDLTLGTQMSLDSGACSAGETGFLFAVDSVSTSGFQAGVMCGAATGTDDDHVTGQAAQDATIDEITTNVEIYTPPLCAQGLDLGGLLTFSDPQLISIDTGGPDSFGDYLGVIGGVVP